MAKYYLTINSRPQALNEVTWARLKYETHNPHNLQSIDEFCMDFEDEGSLKNHLENVAIHMYQSGLIETLPNFKNELNIRYINKKAIRTLSYGIPYKKDNKYFDYEYLRAHLQTLRNDGLFLARLASSFNGPPIQAANIALFHRASICLKKGERFPEEDKFYKAMQDFINVQLFQYDREAHDFKTDKNGGLIYKYRQLHDLAMFVKNYAAQQEKSSKQEGIIVDAPKLRKKPPESEVFEQLSLFDN